MTPERVTNLVTEPRENSNTHSHNPDVYLALNRVSAGGASGDQSGRENQRVTGDEWHESTDKQTRAGEDQSPNHRIEQYRTGLGVPAADLVRN
jgi:hypothetical protein